jgi:hypothetical protein
MEGENVYIIDSQGHRHALLKSVAAAYSPVLAAQMQTGETLLTHPSMSSQDTKAIVAYMDLLRLRKTTQITNHLGGARDLSDVANHSEWIWCDYHIKGNPKSLIFHASRLQVDELVRMLACRTFLGLRHRVLSIERETYGFVPLPWKGLFSLVFICVVLETLVLFGALADMHNPGSLTVLIEGVISMALWLFSAYAALKLDLCRREATFVWNLCAIFSEVFSFVMVVVLMYTYRDRPGSNKLNLWSNLMCAIFFFAVIIVTCNHKSRYCTSFSADLQGFPSDFIAEISSFSVTDTPASSPRSYA